VKDPLVLASGDFAPVYLLWGEDHGALSEALRGLRQAILHPEGVDSGMDAFNHETFDARYLGAASRVLNACGQLPVMAKHRLVELASPEEFGAHRRKSRDDEAVPASPESRRDDAVRAVMDYMAEPNPGAILLIHSTGIKGTSKLVKAAKKAPQVLEIRFQVANDADAISMLIAAARRRKIPLQRDAAQALVSAVGPKMGDLIPALERAWAYAEGPVQREHVDAVVVTTREANVFDLTDAIGNRDASAALALLARMFSTGEKDPGTALRLMGMLLWHMRRLFVVVSAEDPAKALGLRPFALRKLESQARTLGEARLRLAYAGLARLDRDLKGGSKLAYESPYLVMQRWVMDVCGVLPHVAPRV